MKIACLSGKGGAGKTFIAVNLAAAAKKCTYIDCDVEEPNGHLFFKPQNVKSSSVNVNVPAFDEKKCDGCKKCVLACRFHALMYIKEKPIVFPEVCHDCGMCSIVCPNQAVSSTQKAIGEMRIGYHNDIKVVSGVLNVGEASGIPIIHENIKQSEGITILDCPPGSACSVMETVMEADYCVLIAEPTAFGFHNFKMIYELAKMLKKPCGVVINKQTEEYKPLEDFCEENGLEILERILFDKKLAQTMAKNEIVAEKTENEADRFRRILAKIGEKI